MALNLPFFNKKSKKGPGIGPEKKETNPLVTLSAGAVIALVIIVLIAVFILQPTISSILNTQKEIVERQELLEKLEAKNTSLAQARTTYNNNSSQFDLLNYALPNDSYHSEDFKIIEHIASDVTGAALAVSPNSNFAILRISLSEVPPYQALTSQPRTGRAYTRTEMKYSLSAKGDYAGIQAFLEKLKANLRNITINQVTFSSPESKNSTLLDVNIQLTSIFYSM